jgi:hypothetical protein
MHLVFLGLGIVMLLGGLANLKRGRGGKLSHPAFAGVFLGLVFVGIGLATAPQRESKAEPSEAPPASVPTPVAKTPKVASSKWTDSEGRPIEAEFLAVTDEGGEITVIFKDTDGKTYKFPLAELSAESRARIEETEEYSRQTR